MTNLENSICVPHLGRKTFEHRVNRRKRLAAEKIKLSNLENCERDSEENVHSLFVTEKEIPHSKQSLELK